MSRVKVESVRCRPWAAGSFCPPAQFEERVERRLLGPARPNLNADPPQALRAIRQQHQFGGSLPHFAWKGRNEVR